MQHQSARNLAGVVSNRHNAIYGGNITGGNSRASFYSSSSSGVGVGVGIRGGRRASISKNIISLECQDDAFHEVGIRVSRVYGYILICIAMYTYIDILLSSIYHG
jgi:hypothetical protein